MSSKIRSTLKASKLNSMATAPRDGTVIYLVEHLFGAFYPGCWDKALGGLWLIGGLYWRDSDFSGWVHIP